MDDARRLSRMAAAAFVVAVMAACQGRSSVPAEEGLFEVVGLGERAAIFQMGGQSTTNVVVVATRRGLVVVDTGVIASRGTALRHAIATRFGRDDIACVVNTHAHFDHVFGNQAFTDVPILAHEHAAVEMRRWYAVGEGLDSFLDGRRRRQIGLEAQLGKAAAGSRDERRIRERMAENQAILDDFGQGRFRLTLPTVLFSDRMTVDLGNLTFRLVHVGRWHTESDLVVHVPQLRLLIVGDLFGKEWLPEFKAADVDVARWFQVLDGLPVGPEAVERVATGHGDAMTGDEFRAQVAYLRDVWEGVAAARRAGATLAATQARLAFENRYPALRHLTRVWDGQDVHLANIAAAWTLQQGK